LFLLCALAFAGCGRSDVAKPSATPSEPTGEPVLLLPSKFKSTPSQQTVQFLGSQGTGRRFCIIADCSNSLSPASFGVIKKEVAKTLESLDEYCQFHIMFFADVAYPMPGGDWLQGKKDLAPVLAWIEKRPRVLGTKPFFPFKKALNLDPPPDVIFFMTDGKIPAKDPERITAMNKSEPRVMINTILFTRTTEVVPPGDYARASLERIAKENGGGFKQFIDPSLPDTVKKKRKK